MTAIVGTVEKPSFLYGDCEPEPCGPPLQIQHWRFERRPPSLYAADIPCRRVRTSAGPAAAFESSGGIDVYIGDRTVVVFADTEQQAARAVAALRPVKDEQLRLPPPRDDLERALRRCAG